MSEGRAVVKRSMERDLAMDIANAVVAYPHADVTLSCEGHLYTISGNDAFVDHLRYEVHWRCGGGRPSRGHRRGRH